MDDNKSSPQFEELLQKALTYPEPEEAFLGNLENRLRGKLAAATRPAVPHKRARGFWQLASQPALVLAGGLLLIGLIALGMRVRPGQLLPAGPPAISPTPGPAETGTPTSQPREGLGERYTVQPGDSLASIADRFGLLPATVLWANFDILADDPSRIQPGVVLTIPPVDGVLYTWLPGDRLAAVAERFCARAEDILGFPANRLAAGEDGSGIPAGARMMIPGGSRLCPGKARPSPTPTPTPAVPQLAVQAELPPLDASGTADLHGLIVFRSAAAMPFLFPGEETGGLTRLGAPGLTSLWAVSPDGLRAGRLSPEGYDAGLYLPAEGKPVLVEAGFHLEDPAFEVVTLPDVCTQAAPGEALLPCDQFRFSADGRLLAFRYGPDICGRALRIVDRQTGETLLDLQAMVHSVSFLANGWAQIYSGHCEGSYASFFDPATRASVTGGGGGRVVWEDDRALFAQVESDYTASFKDIWGYQLETGTVFRPEPALSGRSPINEHILFLPGKAAFIYQHLTYKAGDEPGTVVFDRPAQIVRYDPLSGERTVLAADPAYSYRLCQEDEPQGCDARWYGDWIQVQRLPFEPATVAWYSGDAFNGSPMPCLSFGQNCPTPPESFALNAVTGELNPWDPAALPAPGPLPAPATGPDLQRPPVYTSPDGSCRFLVGMDGHSLWLVPATGEAVLWVREGEDFVYLP